MQTGTDYGDLAPLVKATGWLVSSSWAVIFGWRGRSRKWAPVEEEIPGGVSRVGGLLTAAALALLWFLAASDLSQGRWLVWVVGGSALVTVLAFLANNFALTQLIYDSRDAAGNPKKVVGGLWLTRNARHDRKQHDDTIEGVLEGNEWNRDRVWSRPAQGLAKVLFLSMYLLFTVGGSAVLAAGAMILLAARQPYIAEFSVVPLEVTVGQPVNMQWRVANANKTNIDPFGAVVAQGQRTLEPDKNTVYTLTAENSYGTRGVQLGVFVKPSIAPVAPLPEEKKKAGKGKQAPAIATTTPPDRGVVWEARDCNLIKGAVIRGEGWLQNETDEDGLAIASCDVNFARGGKYEMFIRYASVGSRPVRVTLNNTILQESALAASTAGWSDPNWVDYTMGVVAAKQGVNTIGFYTEHRFPHIQRLRFVPLF